MIETITRTQQVKFDDAATMFKAIRASSRSAGDGHHFIYRQQFNGVDRHDKLWYEFESQHTFIHWRAKLILSILL